MAIPTRWLHSPQRLPGGPAPYSAMQGLPSTGGEILSGSLFQSSRGLGSGCFLLTLTSTASRVAPTQYAPSCRCRPPSRGVQPQHGRGSLHSNSDNCSLPCAGKRLAHAVRDVGDHWDRGSLTKGHRSHGCLLSLLGF